MAQSYGINNMIPPAAYITHMPRISQT